jgi:UDP-glucuronate decarboxylase
MLENDGRVVSNFLVQALQGEPITVYGTRSFCFIDDLVRGLETLMESPPSLTGPFNLGNPQEMTIEEIAREVLACTQLAVPPPKMGAAMRHRGSHWPPIIRSDFKAQAAAW